MGWTLQDAAVVDGHHLVLVFSVDFASPRVAWRVPTQLIRYSGKEEHAPYTANCLKLATLRHYRERHRDLEGTCDPMEGRSELVSSFEKFCERHSVPDLPDGAHHVTAKVTLE